MQDRTTPPEAILDRAAERAVTECATISLSLLKVSATLPPFGGGAIAVGGSGVLLVLLRARRAW